MTMGMNAFAILAMAPPQGGQGGSGGGMAGMIGYMLIFFAIFYFLMIRPQMRKEKERKALLANVKSGDRVLFSGGILGVVTNVKDDTLVIKIADNVKIEAAKGAVLRVLDKGDDIGTVEAAR
jgi:preprotein translocase subunit YajC